MRETQESIGAWVEQTFGPGTAKRHATRVGEEVVELIQVLFNEPGSEKAAAEAADVLIVLYAVASSLGVDLHEEVDKKMQINRGRKWRIDGDGCGYHVKEDGE